MKVDRPGTRKSMTHIKKFCAAIIGCGEIGYASGRRWEGAGSLSYMDAFQKSDNIDVVCAVDVDQNTCSQISKKYGIPCFQDVNEISQCFSLDVITVSTPDNTHKEILTDILALKPKLVICEKPLALSLKDAEELTSLYEKNNVPLCVNFSRRFLNEYQNIHDLILNGQAGRVQSVLIYYSRGFLHNACHYIDLILWWFGEPDTIIIEGHRAGIFPGDPSYSLCLRYNNSTEIRLVALENSSMIINEIDIIGTKKRIHIDTWGYLRTYSLVKHPDYESIQLFSEEIKSTIDLKMALPNLTCWAKQFLDGKVEMKSSAKNSLAVHKLMERIMGET